MRVFAAALALLAFAPAAQAAPELIAREQAPFTAAAHGGLIAWSSYDAVTKTFALKLRSNGVTSTPAVAPKATAFDVDLGRGPDGGTVAVYSRDGDLFLYDPATGVERRLEALSSRSRAESLPTIEGGNVAFRRTVAGKDRLHLGGVREPLRRDTTQITHIELAGGHLLFVGNGPSRRGFGTSTLFRARVGKAPVALYDTESGGANSSQVIGPASAARRVYFAETNHGSGTGNRLYRSTPNGRQLVQARGSALISSLDWAGDRFLLAKSFAGDGCLARLDDPPERSRCTLELSDPPAFGATPR